MRWRRSKSTPDVIDQRAAAPRVGLPFPGGRAGVGGGLGVVGLLIFLAITLLGGGGGTAFDVGRQFDDAQAPEAGTEAGIPAEQDPERDLRDFSDGFVAILLPVYLTALGFGALEVGVIATAALLGSSLTTLGIGLFGRPGSQRALLVAASALMAATGLAFATVNELAWLFVIAFVGTSYSISTASTTPTMVIHSSESKPHMSRCPMGSPAPKLWRARDSLMTATNGRS